MRKAEVYWIIDIWPNLKCMFDKPIIIFSLFKILTYGKWYKPESGLKFSLKISSENVIIEENIT